MKYELCYLVGESKSQDLQKIKSDVNEIISKEGGKWDELQTEERRKMAYKVGRDVRGIYIAQQFEIEKNEEVEDAKNPLAEMGKKLNLYQNILRYIFVKAEDLPELKIREEKRSFEKTGPLSKKDFKKPVYMQKAEIASKKDESDKKEVQPEEKTDKLKEEEEIVEKPEAETAKKEKEKEKSIDEKIDEILNI